MLWHWIVFVLIGAVAGWLGSLIIKGSGSGFWINLLLGVVGAVLGGWLFGVLGLPGGSLLWQFIAAVVGAVVVLIIWGIIARAFRKK